MNLPQVIEVRGIRVLTTKQLAELYGTDPERIKLNYRYNKERYIVGKHIIPIEDAELREFKARYQFNTSFKYAKSLYLWTEKGALLHAKSLNTDKAWEVYDYHVDMLKGVSFLILS
jgi:toxin-antitoxin system, toxin component, bro family